MSAFLASVIVLAVIVGVLRLILVEIEAAADVDQEDVGQEQEPATAPAWIERGAVAVQRHRVDARVRLVVLVAGAGTLVAALVSAMIALIARVAR
ncbi:MAG: hypothetical protein ACRD0Q_09360 [Acidimicrobiales bacterium]